MKHHWGKGLKEEKPMGSRYSLKRTKQDMYAPVQEGEGSYDLEPEAEIVSSGLHHLPARLGGTNLNLHCCYCTL